MRSGFLIQWSAICLVLTVACQRSVQRSPAELGIVSTEPERALGEPTEPPGATSSPAPDPGRGRAASDGARPSPEEVQVLFLHHSTGGNIWRGGVPEWIGRYNLRHRTRYTVTAVEFPKHTPYGWNNYPYDYWNIWVNHAGPAPYQEEPTLELLTQQYQVIIWKHCFPVGKMEEDSGNGDVASDRRTKENYMLQYLALKNKMRQFPTTRFIVWTGAALVRTATNPGAAARTRAFFDWVGREWDEPGDNIFIWDFWQLETGGGLYLLPKNAVSSNDAHPHPDFAARVAPLLGQRIVDVIEGRGDSGSVTGETTG